MEFPRWLKVVWWLLLIIGSVIFLIIRIDPILSNKGNIFDVCIFLLLIGLLLTPLFYEINLFGINFKRELEEFKGEVRENILNLRADIQNSIDFRASYNPQIYFGSSTPPPSDSRLHDIIGPFKEILEETLENYGIEKPGDEEIDFEVSTTSEYLFKVRHAIEKELRNIWNDRFDEEKPQRHLSIHKITRALIESELISPKLGSIIRDVYAICSPAVHGEEVSAEQVEFVQNVAPELIASLRAIY